MKQTNLYWLAIPVAVLALCLFLRSEMDRNRENLRRDAREEMKAASTSLIDTAAEVLRKVPEDWGRGAPALTNRATVTNLDAVTVAGRLFDVAAQTVQQLDRVGLEATRMSDAEESEAGAEMDREILREFPAVPDSPDLSRLERLMKPILEQRQRQQIQYTLRVVDSRMVNAFSLAGGYVYVTTAFLKEFPADASLVMTLAHEVGHVDLRHCVERVQYGRRARGAVGGLADVGQLVYGAFSTPFTKDQEFAADKYGFLACRQAGWRATDLLNLLTELEAYERRAAGNDRTPAPGSLEARIGNFLQSHPPTDERKRSLENLPR